MINCSVAALELTVRLPGDEESRTLHTAHGGAYELGVRERDHGVPLAPFPTADRWDGAIAVPRRCAAGVVPADRAMAGFSVRSRWETDG